MIGRTSVTPSKICLKLARRNGLDEMKHCEAQQGKEGGSCSLKLANSKGQSEREIDRIHLKKVTVIVQ